MLHATRPTADAGEKAVVGLDFIVATTSWRREIQDGRKLFARKILSDAGMFCTILFPLRALPPM